MPRRLRLFFAVPVVVAIVIAGASTPLAAQVTTTPEATTTTAPATTTTVATTTTSTNAPTTTVPSSTTTVSTTTTSVPATASSDDSNSGVWVLIIVLLALAAIALIAVLIVRRRRAASTKGEWNAAAASALRDAELTRDMLSGEARPGEPEDPTRQRAVDENVQRVSTRFEQLAAAAPDDRSRQGAAAVATSLRGYLFALEAERLLRTAPTPPSAEQLAAADSTRRARANDLEAALEQLRTSTSEKK